MRTLTIMALAALAGAISAPALAQPAASPHQHGQATTPSQTPQPGQPKGMQGTDGQCDCCGMMKEMMQMMRKMHQHGSQTGAMQKMDMMRSSGAPAQDGAPGDAEHQQHEEKPRN